MHDRHLHAGQDIPAQNETAGDNVEPTDEAPHATEPGVQASVPQVQCDTGGGEQPVETAKNLAPAASWMTVRADDSDDDTAPPGNDTAASAIPQPRVGSGTLKPRKRSASADMHNPLLSAPRIDLSSVKGRSGAEKLGEVWVRVGTPGDKEAPVSRKEVDRYGRLYCATQALH